jgi:hypothetical protein
LVLVLAFIA